MATTSRSSGARNSSNIPFDSSVSSSRSLPLFLAGTFSFRVGRGGRGGLGDDNRSLGRLSEMLWVGEDIGSADDGTLVGLDILGRALRLVDNLDGPGVGSTSMSSSDSSVMIARLFPFLLLLLPSFI